MKTKLLTLIALIIVGLIDAQSYPIDVENATSGNLNIRAAQPCTTATVAASLATNSNLVASSYVGSSCSYSWYEVDIPLTSTPTIQYYGASGANFLVPTTHNYVEVTSNVPNGLRIRDTPGGNLLWIGNNYAALWWIGSSSRGQRMAYTGAPVQMIGLDIWIQIFLPYNYCTVGQNGPYIQTGWVSNGQGQPDGPYLNYLPTMLNEQQSQNSISIFPNPSSGKFQIAIEKTNVSSIKITDLLGGVIFESPTNELNGEIDLSDKPEGIYLCQFMSGGMIIETKKIILQ